MAGSAADDTPTAGSGGPNAAQNVVVVDTLPLDPKKLTVQFLSPGCTYTPVTHQVTCTTASLPAGTAVTYEIQVQIKGSVGTIANRATVTSDTFDPTAANNTDTVNNASRAAPARGPSRADAALNAWRRSGCSTLTGAEPARSPPYRRLELLTRA